MKYSDNFNRDFNWYLSMRHKFTFSGDVLSIDINQDSNGISGKEAFKRYDSEGKVYPTKHPNILRTIFQVKASCNFHIKLYAIDRAKQFLSGIELKEIIAELNPPEWFVKAIENQRKKLCVSL